MGYRLEWEMDRYVYRIGWRDTDTGDMDAHLGQDSSDGTGRAPTDRDGWEHWAASKAVRETKPKRDSRGFYWEDRRNVVGALALAKEALKQERPLPDWASRALAAGWKAPKNWKA